MGWEEIQLSGISASSGVDDGEMGTLLPHPFSVEVEIHLLISLISAIYMNMTLQLSGST